MQKKVFWSVFSVLNLLAGYLLPLLWSLAATIPITLLSWWVAYRWLDL